MKQPACSKCGWTGHPGGVLGDGIHVDWRRCPDCGNPKVKAVSVQSGDVTALEEQWKVYTAMALNGDVQVNDEKERVR